MEFGNKVISKEIQQYLYDHGKTLGTAESCTGGRIAEAIISIPGASNYFKGGIISYTDEIKERLLHVDHQLLQEKTAVCEEVAIQMVKGACSTLGVDYAISATGIAGPGGGTHEIPVGTIWLAYGTCDDIQTILLTKDNGRDVNLTIATNTVLKEFCNYLKQKYEEARQNDPEQDPLNEQ